MQDIGLFLFMIIRMVWPRLSRWCTNGHLATYFHLSRNFLYCQSSLSSCILSQIGLGGFPAGGEDFQPHIAAQLGPFVVLLGEDGADQPDDGVPVLQSRFVT